MDERHVDILIIGGGLIGVALLLALSNSGYNTLLVEAKVFREQDPADFDARSLALSLASVRILEMLNVWPSLLKDATEIETIHVSEQQCFGQTRLHGEENNPLGFVVEMQHINQALHGILDKEQVLAPANLVAFDCEKNTAMVRVDSKDVRIRASLVVAADGSNSAVRRFCGLAAQIKEYGQRAIVANIGLARAHRQIAYERFTEFGPLALLPMSRMRASLVWTLPPDRAEALMQASSRDFIKALQRAFGYRLGRFVQVRHRQVFPLKQIIMPKAQLGEVIFIGNAAHTLHPVAGQGFNLGLRDVAMLAQCITEHGLNEAMLTTYLRKRRHDQAAIITFTDSLLDLFKSRLPGMAFARGMGLLALDNLSMAQYFLTYYARGFAGTVPDLVCNIPLHALGTS